MIQNNSRSLDCPILLNPPEPDVFFSAGDQNRRVYRRELQVHNVEIRTLLRNVDQRSRLRAVRRAKASNIINCDSFPVLPRPANDRNKFAIVRKR